MCLHFNDKTDKCQERWRKNEFIHHFESGGGNIRLRCAIIKNGDDGTDMKKTGIIKGFWLKVIMSVFMVLDHIYYFLPGQPIWMTMLGRLVAPVFAFLVAEGMYYTHDRKRYIGRMLWFGVAMLFGNIILMLIFKTPISNSILVSLAISAKLVDTAEKYLSGESRAAALVSIVLLSLTTFFFEGMWLCPLMVAIFYFLRERPLIMSLAYAGGVVPAVHFLKMGASYQWLMIFALIPIFMYNGKRGPDYPAAKYFFYAFYPIHIWILYIVGQVFF